MTTDPQERAASEVRFDDQVVVVTGAGKGLGRAHAELLAQRGAIVVVNNRDRSAPGLPPSADRVAAQITAAGGRAHADRHDIGSAAACAELVADTIARFGRLDAIIHNAGILEFGGVATLTDAGWQSMVDVHLGAAFWLSRAAWPHFVARGGGRLLFTTSLAGLYGAPDHAHYGAAKAGVVGLARCLHSEGAEHGIVSNALAVGAYTDMSAMAFVQAPSIGRFWEANMLPELVSAAAAWLVHPDCDARGQVFEVCGARLSEVVVSETRGLRKLGFTLDDVRDHWDSVLDQDDLQIIRGADDFISMVVQAVIELGAAPPELDRNVPWKR